MSYFAYDYHAVDENRNIELGYAISEYEDHDGFIEYIKAEDFESFLEKNGDLLEPFEQYMMDFENQSHEYYKLIFKEYFQSKVSHKILPLVEESIQDQNTKLHHLNLIKLSLAS